MQLADKVKIALDETRMLMLGANILLGFELRGPFASAFEHLPAYAQYVEGLGLGLMVLVTGLLIAPEAYHRIVEGGSDSGRLHDLVTGFADAALLPFGLAIGVDVFVAAVRIFGETAAIAAGAGAAAVALALWYGLPRARRQNRGQSERAMTEQQHGDRPHTPLHTKIEQMLTEARVILPGAQAILGFQLSIVLTDAFERLPMASRLAHAVSLGLVAFAVILLMAPAAYHRIVYAGEDTDEMHRTGSRMVGGAMLPLAAGLAVDIYVVIAKIAGETAGVASAAAALLLLLGLWYGFPLAARAAHARAPSHAGSVQPQS